MALVSTTIVLPTVLGYLPKRGIKKEDSPPSAVTGFRTWYCTSLPDCFLSHGLVNLTGPPRPWATCLLLPSTARISPHTSVLVVLSPNNQHWVHGPWDNNNKHIWERSSCGKAMQWRES